MIYSCRPKHRVHYLNYFNCSSCNTQHATVTAQYNRHAFYNSIQILNCIEANMMYRRVGIEAFFSSCGAP